MFFSLFFFQTTPRVSVDFVWEEEKAKNHDFFPTCFAVPKVEIRRCAVMHSSSSGSRQKRAARSLPSSFEWGEGSFSPSEINQAAADEKR